MEFNVLQLLLYQDEALFIHDKNNKLLGINEPEPENLPPRFFLSRCLEGNLWRYRSDLPNDLIVELEKIVKKEPILQKLNDEPIYKNQYEDLLNQYSPISKIESGLSFYIPKQNFESIANAITPTNKNVLKINFPWTFKEYKDRSPIEAIIKDNVAVSVCCCARNTIKVAEAGVFTMEDYRGKGYAVETVKNWAKEIYQLNKVPLYSTSTTNKASQAVAKHLNSIQYGVNYSIY